MEDITENSVYDLPDAVETVYEVVAAAVDDYSNHRSVHNKYLYFQYINGLYSSQHITYDIRSININLLDSFYKHQRYIYHGLENWSEIQADQENIEDEGLVKSYASPYGSKRHITIEEPQKNYKKLDMRLMSTLPTLVLVGLKELLIITLISLEGLIIVTLKQL